MLRVLGDCAGLELRLSDLQRVLLDRHRFVCEVDLQVGLRAEKPALRDLRGQRLPSVLERQLCRHELVGRRAGTRSESAPDIHFPLQVERSATARRVTAAIPAGLVSTSAEANRGLEERAGSLRVARRGFDPGRGCLQVGVVGQCVDDELDELLVTEGRDSTVLDLLLRAVPNDPAVSRTGQSSCPPKRAIKHSSTVGTRFERRVPERTDGCQRRIG